MQNIEIDELTENQIVHAWAKAMKDSYDYRGTPDRLAHTNFLDGFEYLMNIIIPGHKRKILKDRAILQSGVPSKYAGGGIKYR